MAGEGGRMEGEMDGREGMKRGRGELVRGVSGRGGEGECSRGVQEKVVP